MKTTPAARLPLVLAAVLAFAVAALYLPSRNFDFIVLDDSEYVYENELVKGGLSVEGVKNAFTETQQFYFIPLTWLSLMADAEFYGMDAGGFHLTNAIFQVVNSLLLFAFLYRATGSPWKSFIASALWTLHPLRVESVAWVTERKDLLSGFFFLLCLLSYLEYSKKEDKGWYMASLGAMGAGLLAKPVAVITPLVLLAADYWPLERLRENSRDLKKLLLEKVPFFLLSAAISLLTLFLQSRNIASAEAVPFSRRLVDVPVALLHYLWKTVWPLNLVIENKPETAPQLWMAAAGAAVVVTLTFAALKRRRSSPAVASGWFWFLAALLPVSGIVVVGLNVVADRFTYIPHMGLFFALVWGIGSLLPANGISGKTVSGLGVAALAALFFLSSTHLARWKDGVTLFTYHFETKPDAFTASALANAYGQAGNYAEAIRMFEDSASRNPLNPSVWKNLGVMYDKTGRHAEAIEAFKRSIGLRPEDSEAYFNIGVAAMDSGDSGLAVTAFENALRLDPKHFRALYNLGKVFKKEGQGEKAAEAFRRAHEQNPGNADALGELGLLAAKAGRMEEARKYFGMALERDRGSFESNLFMALSLLESGRPGEAEEFFLRAIEINPQNPSAHYNYGVLLEKTGRKGEALYHYREVLRLAPEGEFSALARERTGGAK